MDDKIVTLAAFYDAMEAEIVRGRLEANDIPCFIADGNFIAANPLYNQAAGGIKIKVFEHDVDKCREILSEKIELEDADDKLYSCPRCSSSDVFYGPSEVEKNWIFLMLSFLTLTHPIFLYKTWHCKACGNKFQSEE